MRVVSLLATLPLVVTAAGGSGVVAKVAVPGTPCGVAGSPGAVWVTEASKGQLVRIDPATNAVTKRVPTDLPRATRGRRARSGRTAFRRALAARSSPRGS